LSVLAGQLWEEIFKCKYETVSYWTRFWEGEKSITPDLVLTILDQLRLFYVRMDEEYQALRSLLPNVKRWNARTAAQKFFTEFLSARMTETLGQPHDSIVVALAEVAFNLTHCVEVETVRGRRRVASAPEKS